MHYYKFNVASWAKDTSHLSLKEEGIYLRLINYYYDTEKPIPLKTNLVLRKLRAAGESEAVSLILEEFFTKTKEGWIHHHCDKLINEYQKMSDRNKKNAKLGGRPKNKDLTKPTGFPVGNQEESDSKPTGIPNYKPITNNQELETKEGNNTLCYATIQEIFNSTLTKANCIAQMTDKRKKLVRKFFTDFNLDYDKFKSYLEYMNDLPDCQWMFEKRPKNDGSGQNWNACKFEYFVSEKCFLNVKENL